MESRYDTLENGLKIHSLVAGNKSFSPLVLLHGYPTDAFLWRNCIPNLSKQFQVYAPDLPGHGQSDIPNSQLKLISECGHFLPEEQPDAITNHIIEFLHK